jgi:hypothetical protein
VTCMHRASILVSDAEKKLASPRGATTFRGAF